LSSLSPEEHIALFKENLELYKQVKRIIVTSENFDPKGEFYVAPVTEIRNTLDHFFRGLEFPERAEWELNEAKEHLYRAGYDTYEILTTNLGTVIANGIDEFEADSVRVIFPAYYDEIRPQLIQIQRELADVRAGKKIDPHTSNKSFDEYWETTNYLIDKCAELEKAKNQLIEYETNKRNKEEEERKNERLEKAAEKAAEKIKSRNQKLWDIFKLGLAAIFGILVSLFFTK